MGTIRPTNTVVPAGVSRRTRPAQERDIDVRATGCARPALLAVLVASTMTACGMGLWNERRAERHAATGLVDGAKPAPVPTPPARTFGIEPADIERQARQGRTATTDHPSRWAPRNKNAARPPMDEPQLSFPETEHAMPPSPRADEWTDSSINEELSLLESAPPAGLATADVGGIPTALLLLVGCGVLGGFLLFRRRGPRRQRREPWTEISWSSPRLIRPYWDYDPGRYDSDDFLQRWDSIGLNIAGEWDLLMAIAGHALPNAFAWSPRPLPMSREMTAVAADPDWIYVSLPGDSPEQQARWDLIDLSIHGDSRLLAAIAGRPEFDAGDMAVDAPMEQVAVIPVPELPAQVESRSPVIAAMAAMTPMEAVDPDVTPTKAEVDPPASEQGTADDMNWLSRAGALFRAWESSGATEHEQALWELSRRLQAHAHALPAPARTPWQDTGEALAERMAAQAPASARDAWRARWIDLRLDRLSAMSGAWRLLELRALHDRCALDTSPQVLEAKLRLLQLWAAALLGPAARAKRAEAAVLAASLRHVRTQEG